MIFLIIVLSRRMEPRSSRIVRPRTGCRKVGAMLHENVKLSILLHNHNMHLTPLEGVIRILSPAFVDEELGVPYRGCHGDNMPEIHQIGCRDLPLLVRFGCLEFSPRSLQRL